MTSATILDGTEGCNEEDQTGRAVPAQRLPVRVKQRWIRQTVRGLQARKVSDNEQMSWYFAQEESMEFNLRCTRYARDLPTIRHFILKFGIKTSRWKKSCSIPIYLYHWFSQGADQNVHQTPKTTHYGRRTGWFTFNTWNTHVDARKHGYSFALPSTICKEFHIHNVQLVKNVSIKTLGLAEQGEV